MFGLLKKILDFIEWWKKPHYRPYDIMWIRERSAALEGEEEEEDD